MTSQVQTIRPSEEFEYYQGTVYWNNFNAVLSHINRLISGRPDQGWASYTRQRYGVCERALFVQCGNGWVERDCFHHGLIKSAVGTDISEALLKEARTEAVKHAIPAEYVSADTNRFDFTTLSYDWVVNHAAFHHIAYLDAAVRSMWRGMKGTGFLIAYDYTGPHRNQYPWEAWSKMLELNASLPARFRSKLHYPHMPTMLATDPSEAVHSELILRVCRRYFDIIELRPLGGAIAYELLYDNKGLHAEQETPEGAAAIARILAADLEFTRSDPDRSFFNYWAAVPRLDGVHEPRELERWTREEDEREEQARRAGLRYSPPTALELIYNEMADLRDRVAAGKAG